MHVVNTNSYVFTQIHNSCSGNSTVKNLNSLRRYSYNKIVILVQQFETNDNIKCIEHLIVTKIIRYTFAQCHHEFTNNTIRIYINARYT